MTDLRLLQTFVQAAQAGSFSSAARRLRISAAAVSQNVKSLEDQLGVRLFTRTTRRIALTPEGERFLHRCAPALEALDEAVRLANDEAEAVEGLIRFTSTTAFGRSQVLPLLAAFMERHPGVRVEMELSDRFVDLVADGFDFAIRGGVLPESEYVARRLITVTPTVCAAPRYLDLHKPPEKLEDIASHRCVGMLSNPSQRVFDWEFQLEGVLVRREIDPTLVVNDPEALAIAAAQGLGLAQIGSNIAAPFIRSGALTPLLAAFQTQSRGIYAVYPTKRYMPMRTKALIDHIAGALSGSAGAVIGRSAE